MQVPLIMLNLVCAQESLLCSRSNAFVFFVRVDVSLSFVHTGTHLSSSLKLYCDDVNGNPKTAQTRWGNAHFCLCRYFSLFTQPIMLAAEHPSAKARG